MEMTKFKKILTGMNLVDAAYGECELVPGHDELYLYCGAVEDPVHLHRRMAELGWDWDADMRGWRMWT